MQNVESKVCKVEEFGGEYEKTSWFYRLSLWVVSFLAMLSNIIKIVLVKIFLRPKEKLVKILWEMGRSKKHYSSIFVDRFSKYNHQGKWGGAGWMSLELFYNYQTWLKPKLDESNGVEKRLTEWWIGKMENRQAVANRLKIAVNLLVEALERIKDQGVGQIRLLSLASGSAQAVIEALKRVPNLDIKVKLIDNDPTAILEAKKNIAKNNLTDIFEVIEGKTNLLEEVCHNFRPNVVEMVGFMDYRPKDKAISLTSRIREQLVDGGIFLTCNIAPNQEKIFLDWVLLWPMIYRTEEQLVEILTQGGFEKIKIYQEPFQIHNIAWCEK